MNREPEDVGSSARSASSQCIYVNKILFPCAVVPTCVKQRFLVAFPSSPRELFLRPNAKYLVPK